MIAVWEFLWVYSYAPFYEPQSVLHLGQISSPKLYLRRFSMRPKLKALRFVSPQTQNAQTALNKPDPETLNPPD